MKKNIIYGLVDPDSKQVRYIGKSTIGLKRPREHKKRSLLLAMSHKNNWIKNLISQNKIYEITILEENIELSKLSEREIYWISFYKENGIILTNSTEGGEGTPGFRFSEESKNNISITKKEWAKNNPDKLKMARSYVEKPNIIKDGITLKNCSDCKIYINIAIFHKDKNRKDGLRTICKPCALTRKNKYYTESFTKLTPEQFQASYESRKDAMSAGLKEAYQNNPELRKKTSERRSKPIIRVNPSTNETKEYQSALNAKLDGFQNTNIGVAIKKRTLYKGYYWKFKS